MLAAHEHDVKLWSRRTEVAEAINRHHHNPSHLSEFELPDRIEATTELGEALAGRELVIIAVPSQALREVMTLAGPHIARGAIIVSAVKGIEYETGLTMHGVLEDVLEAEHHPRLVALSGPSFAREVANRQPTVVTLACREEAFAVAVQATLSCPWFRCYTQHDVIGVETAGALKNVIAIAIGMCDGMRAGHNARAALMTRGLAEITRLGVRLGAEPETFLGLAGMGDLLLTCTGDLSRNRRVGLKLAEGQDLDDIVAELGEVAEGIPTTRAACRLAARLGVELPIAEQVRAVLDGEKTPAEAGWTLMARQLRSERDRGEK
ncbi:MAG: NAD(P)-dependent glycerol-3-phosphate dehydrogenase [Deltaproteobacteria bacterium]|jgi:glycerol-3-phosphate dehydrogenase (NAD(P)+)|nr:NAD(P)-dependent glycerol-3-phosphate dehydrogenase [Deltaproteobacteria bacterium]MBW2501197.1 NAD(P)-dependent glycerol-3-phosphate dehydrogenase [Deltaproteobacteria bacterium]